MVANPSAYSMLLPRRNASGAHQSCALINGCARCKRVISMEGVDSAVVEFSISHRWNHVGAESFLHCR